MNHTKDALRRQRVGLVVVLIIAGLWWFTPLGKRPEPPAGATSTQSR